jgi:hypothetical protein
LATWPKSGMTQNGRAFELPTLEQPIKGSVSSSLPTPRANEPGSTSPGYGDSLNDFASRITTGYAPKDLLRTPAASEAERGHQTESVARARGGQVTLSGQMLELFPTLKARDSQAEGYEAGLRRSSPQVGTIVKGLVSKDPRILFPTPVAQDTETSWGKFEPAIRRWEKTLGRPAPAPTKPDGRHNAHRLSSIFTEWLMGLPEGWITGLGLKRNDELKLAGNGVVPQQAELALRILLEDDNLLERIKK